MGINAVAVYDIPKHTTVILRTPTASRLRRHEILDTIATFSQHCESVRGSSLTVTQVSALWGGPPFVTYSIAASCFRVIIVWDEETSDVNVAYDVYHAITRLQNVVNSSAEALIQRESSTVTLVYEEAGHALRTDEPFILPVTISPTANRSNIFSSLGNRRQTLPPSTDPKKRISNATSNTTPKKKTLLTKLGAVLSLSSQNSKQTKPKQSEIDVQQSLKSLPPTDVFGPDGSLDNAEGPLALPQGVFEWCYFGDPLPEDAGNLNWFGHLFQPESFVAPTPSAGSFKSSFPALRTGSVSSTPLTVPSSAPPIAPALKEAAPSSITAPAPQTNGDAESTEKQQNGETIEKPNSNDSAEKALLLPAQPQIPPTPPSNEQVDPLQAPLSQPLQSTPSLESGLQPVSTSTNPLDATPVPSQETSVQNPMISFSPVQQQQQQIQNELQNKRQKLLEEQQRLQHNLQQQNVNSQTQNQQQLQQPHLLQQQQLQQQQQHQQLQQQQLQQQQLQQQQLQQQQLQQQQQLHLQQQQNLQFPQQAPTIQSTPTNSSQTVPKTTDNEIPEALRQKPDDFDLSQLGGYKDSASIAMQETSGTIAINEPSDLKKAEDEAIRNRMNEFAISMQNGNFTSALRQVYDTLKLLCRIEPRRDREIITCSNYVLAQKILIRNTVLENEISSITIQVGNPILNQKRVECALLAMFLAELKHILPRHRVAAMRVAVEKNFQVGNFGMCARWLKQLIDKAPPNQKPLLMTQLQTCIANREQNAHMPPTNRLCYTTLQVLASPFAACNVCPAVYHASLSGMVDGQACDTCFVGTIHPKQ